MWNKVNYASIREYRRMSEREHIAQDFRTLQLQITEALTRFSSDLHFRKDIWKRTEGGGGITQIIEHGEVLESGAVNVSEVYGALSSTTQKLLDTSEEQFYATGLSVILHPRNPHVPIIHMNVRYFELSTENYWFGGGIDLTPHYINKTEAKHFHEKLYLCCQKHAQIASYETFKQNADEYFYLPHRKETRGIGGIFFDKLRPSSKELGQRFVKDLAETFIPIYLPLVEVNSKKPYTESQRQWQLFRRGRYVEFNLLWDRGTRFGIESHGRTASVLMSLPTIATWHYEVPTQDTKELETQSLLRKGIHWRTSTWK